MMQSAIYVGTIRHRRFRPRAHEFTYPLFMAFLDIDKLPELMSASRLCSYNRWNIASFHQADHFGESHLSLRERLREDARAQGLELPDGQIFLLTHLRYWGYTFNPVSFYYCYDAEGRLRTIMAEVNNTFGETHNYWLPSPQVIEHSGQFSFAKDFHVSPFLSLDCEYRWTFNLPGDGLIVQTNAAEHGEPTFDGTLRMQHRPWNAQAIAKTLLEFPWVTAKVIATIHWNAIRLWWKGVPVVRHPGAGRYSKVTAPHVGANWSEE